MTVPGLPRGAARGLALDHRARARVNLW